MQHADAVHEVEAPLPDRRMKDVALHQMHVRKMLRVLARGFDGLAEIHPDHLGAILRGVEERPPEAAAAVEPDAPREKRGRDRLDRVEKDLFPVRVHLLELAPLVAVALERATLGIPPRSAR